VRVHQPQRIELGRSTGKSAAHRIDKIRARLGLYETWLDFGCGAGDYASLLANHSCQKIVGVDVLEDPPGDSRHIPGLQFVQTRSSSLPFPDASFDGALMNEVLEHVKMSGRHCGKSGGYSHPVDTLLFSAQTGGFHLRATAQRSDTTSYAG
jgi:2-polyprenyl-3-methyl-5-hydroxy-6-metoxy-1,4-benzoquinol methylase